jgi:hypothetical protein
MANRINNDETFAFVLAALKLAGFQTTPQNVELAYSEAVNLVKEYRENNQKDPANDPLRPPPAKLWNS